MLGADALNQTVGRLVYNRFAEFLPLLGAFLISNNDIVKPIPGFVAYNITDGMMATDVTGWFSRWLLCQDFTTCSTTLKLSAQDTPRRASRLEAYVTGIVLMGPVLAFPIIMGDWWGLVNAISMLVSILVRKLVIEQNRGAITVAAQMAIRSSNQVVKTFWTLPTGTVITVMLPRGILTDVLLTNPCPHRLRLYNIARAVGWIAFGCHVISLGMTALFNQILSVVVLLLATLLVVYRVGEEESLIGHSLVISRYDTLKDRFRAATYARLQLSKSEEESMILWNLFPHRSNNKWWARYYESVKKGGNAFDEWDRQLASYDTIEHKSSRKVVGEV